MIESMANITAKLEAHFRNRVLLQISKIKGLEQKCEKQQEEIDKYEAQKNNTIIRSSIDTNKIID